MKKRMISFRLDPPDVARLNTLARQTGRNRSEVLRRLILLAEHPEAVLLLGRKHNASGGADE